MSAFRKKRLTLHIMEYTKITFRFDDDAESYVPDIVAAQLGEISFDSFEETTQGIVGYCPTHLFDEQAMNRAIGQLPCHVGYRYRIEPMEDKNWNEVWEQNTFAPIDIDGRCIIFGTRNAPEIQCEYPIEINPKQAFGSGHHQTTRLIIRHLLNFELTNKRVLDMGCGTGVLGIVAAKRGAQCVVAIDIDPWSQRNAQENAALNGVSDRIDVRLGSMEQIGSDRFDVVLANINRNTLLKQMAAYATALNAGGTLIISGFYATDTEILQHCAEKVGLHFVAEQTDENWTMCVFEK